MCVRHSRLLRRRSCRQAARPSQKSPKETSKLMSSSGGRGSSPKARRRTQAPKTSGEMSAACRKQLSWEGWARDPYRFRHAVASFGRYEIWETGGRTASRRVFLRDVVCPCKGGDVYEFAGNPRENRLPSTVRRLRRSKSSASAMRKLHPSRLRATGRPVGPGSSR